MTDLADAVDELLVLWPALPIALPRDTGTSSGERVTVSENVHTVPLNIQVAAVITHLTWAVPHWVTWAATNAAQSPTTHAGIPDLLRRIPALHNALNGLGRTRDAARLTDTVHGWLTDSRRALGLDAPDTPFGEDCPRHDNPRHPLTTPGVVGHLHWTRLDPAGHPVDPWITETHTDIVQCRHCGSLWTPDRYRWLARLIKQAKAEREAAAEEEAEEDDAA